MQTMACYILMNRSRDMYPVDVEPMPYTTSNELAQNQSESAVRWMLGPDPNGFFYKTVVGGLRQMLKRRRSSRDQPLNSREMRRYERQGAMRTISQYTHQALKHSETHAGHDIKHPETLLEGYRASQVRYRDGEKVLTHRGSVYVGIDPWLIEKAYPGLQHDGKLQAGVFVRLSEPYPTSGFSLSRKPAEIAYDSKLGYPEVGLEIIDGMKTGEDGRVIKNRLITRTYTEDDINSLRPEQRPYIASIFHTVSHGADILRIYGVGYKPS
jgi:hypothetical protein